MNAKLEKTTFGKKFHNEERYIAETAAHCRRCSSNQVSATCHAANKHRKVRRLFYIIAASGAARLNIYWHQFDEVSS